MALLQPLDTLILCYAPMNLAVSQSLTQKSIQDFSCVVDLFHISQCHCDSSTDDVIDFASFLRLY